MEMTGNYLLTYDWAGGMVCYDFREKKGRRMGVKGRGPREYLDIISIAPDEPNDIIYALVDMPTQSAVYKYNFEGKFLDSFVPGEKVRATNIGLCGEGYLVIHFANFSGNGKTNTRL